MTDVSIRTLLLEFVDANGASHIREMHVEILRQRPDTPEHTIRARLSEAVSDGLLDRLGDGFYDVYAEDEGMTSVVSYPNRCQLWGDSRYGGNCDGRLIRDLVLRYHARRVADPMEGSGTSRDVVEGLNKYKRTGISYWGGDLRSGFDLTRQELPGRFDFVWIHPPYWNIIEYRSGPGDLSNCESYGRFRELLRVCLRRCYEALEVGGRLAVLIGDVRRAGRDLDAYDRWLDGALAECDKALAACEKCRIKVLVDLHTPPGGRANGGVCRMFQEKRYQDKQIEVWDRIARRYRGREVVYAYDLLNEAVEGTVADGLLNWRDLATKAAETIRTVDPGKPVVFEPSPWGGPDGFDVLEPLDVDRVIYSFHMYRPHSFTHQGVYEDKRSIEYPGRIDGEFWDKERLREEMLPAVEFQQAFNVQVYVGEFSVIRWAPGDSGYYYLRDVVDLFEQYGWDWSYHAFREWDGWSVEHGPDRNDHSLTEEPTKRKELLLRWFAKNQRP